MTMVGYTVFYINGLPTQLKPGNTTLWTNRSGIKLHKYEIAWVDMTDVQIKYEVVERSGSIGGAVAGGLIAGEAGAIVGGLSGGKKVDSYLTITYTAENQTYNLIMIAKLAEKIKKLYEKRSNKHREPTEQLKSAKPSLAVRSVKGYFGLYPKGYRLAKKVLAKNKPEQ